MNFDTIDWYLARGTGMAAVVLLTITVALGIALSLKLSSPRWPRLLTNEVHQSVTTLALWTTGLHILAILLDSQAGVSIFNAVVPFSAGWEPLWTGIGVVATYSVLVVWASSRLRDRIGYRTWRQLHMLAFLAYGAAMLHAVMSGTDTGGLWTTGIYLSSAVLVGGLLVARIQASRARRGPRPGTPSRPAPSARPPAPGAPRPADTQAAVTQVLPRLAGRPEPGGLPPLPGAGGMSQT